MRRLAGSILLLLILPPLTAGCVTRSNAIFAGPARFEGRLVRICGYFHDRFEDRNVWRSKVAYRRRDEGDGIGFIPLRELVEPSGVDDRSTCIRARIVRTGCAEEYMCAWSSFPWAAREVETRRIGPGSREEP